MLFTLAWGIALTAICFQSTQPRYLRDSAVPSSDDYEEEEEDGGCDATCQSRRTSQAETNEDRDGLLSNVALDDDDEKMTTDRAVV